MPSYRHLAWVITVCAILGGAAWWLMPRSPRAPARHSGAGPQCVISLSPAFTEMVYALGAGERLVGVSDFCEYPPQAKALPRCGGLVNPNLERITSLKPSLVLVQDELAHLTDQLAPRGVRTWAHPLDTLAEVDDALVKLGETLGCPAAGRAAAFRLRTQLGVVRRRVAGRPRIKVFVCLGRQPDRIAGLTTCGATWLDEVIAAAGGVNVYHDSPRQYPMPGLEDVMAKAPEVILDIQPGLPAGQVGRVANQWRELTTLPAVRAGRVHVLTDDDTLIPGPRLGAVAARLAELLHPEVRAGR